MFLSLSSRWQLRWVVCVFVQIWPAQNWIYLTLVGQSSFMADPVKKTANSVDPTLSKPESGLYSVQIQLSWRELFHYSDIPEVMSLC